MIGLSVSSKTNMYESNEASSTLSRRGTPRTCLSR
jgi:hypothetical protein